MVRSILPDGFHETNKTVRGRPGFGSKSTTLIHARDALDDLTVHDERNTLDEEGVSSGLVSRADYTPLSFCSRMLFNGCQAARPDWFPRERHGTSKKSYERISSRDVGESAHDPVVEFYTKYSG